MHGHKHSFRSCAAAVRPQRFEELAQHASASATATLCALRPRLTCRVDLAEACVGPVGKNNGALRVDAQGGGVVEERHSKGAVRRASLAVLTSNH